MPQQEAAGVRYVTFPSFDRYGIVHGAFTRHGGVSPRPWASLNQGGLLGDERENVVENRRRIFSALGRQVESLYDCWLVHGTDALLVQKPRPLEQPHQKADIILTDRPEITLYMRFADCVPILLYDPVRRVIGLAHAGWRGTVDRIAGVAVEQMRRAYGSHPGDVHAVIGPSICVDHYEIGRHSEAHQRALERFSGPGEDVLSEQNDRLHFDLWKANQIVLESCGVRQIEQSGICTFCDNADWFSHRAEHGSTGRFGVLLALPAA